MPKISVILPVYNNDKYLKLAIESILNQTERDFELIVINNASSDNSLKIINELAEKDKRIVVVTREENKGLVYSLNQGVNLAKGEYIARMDADDISKPIRFERQLQFMKVNDLVICGTWAEGINGSGEKIREVNYPPNADKIKTFTLLHTPFIHPSVMFKSDIIKKVGGYKKFFKNIEDYELWTRIIFKYKAGNIQEPLLSYRFHDEQMTKKFNFG